MQQPLYGAPDAKPEDRLPGESDAEYFARQIRRARDILAETRR